jgi:CheY-like chemotaxis protein
MVLLETRDAIARIPADDGHAVATAAMSFERLNLLGRSDLDLIIIDIVMRPATPHGLALGRIIRTKNHQQKLLYLSGQTPALTKPIGAAHLRDAMRHALAGNA